METQSPASALFRRYLSFPSEASTSKFNKQTEMLRSNKWKTWRVSGRGGVLKLYGGPQVPPLDLFERTLGRSE